MRKKLKELIPQILFWSFVFAIFAVILIQRDKDRMDQNLGNPKVVQAMQETEIVQAPEVVSEPELINLGEFKITHYCSCKKCTGDGDGVTKTGTVATVNRTIGVDPSVIPLGTTVYIGGVEYIAEDVGGGVKGRHIDMFVSGHQEALELGVKHEEVWTYENE